MAEPHGPEQACLGVGLGPAHRSPRHRVWGGLFRDLLRARDPSCLLSRNVTAVLSLSLGRKPPGPHDSFHHGRDGGVTVACYQTTSAFNDPAPRVSEKGPVLPGSLTAGPQHTAKPRKKLNSLGTVPLRPHTGRTGQRSLGARPRASW